MKVTWEYLAGFTDGEGYLGIIGRGPRVSWGQKDKHQLDVLYDFLQEQGFHPTLYLRKQNIEGRVRPKHLWILSMGRREEIQHLCEILLDHVVLKVQQCTLVLQWLKEHPRRWHTAELEHDLVRQYVEEGYTQIQIGVLMGCSAQKIYKLGKKLGITFHKSGGKIENGKHVEAMSRDAYLIHKQKKEKICRCLDCNTFIYRGSQRCNTCAVKHRHQIKRESCKELSTKSATSATSPLEAQEKP